MRRINKIVLSIGVAIIVAPIFSSALAQTQQTQILLEMQSLREEVGQLRDMVERQGNTIRLLERRLVQAQDPSSVGSQYGGGAYNGDTTYTGPSGTGIDNTAAGTPYTPGSANFDPANSAPDVATGFPPQPDVYQGGQVQLPQQNEQSGEYRPFDPNTASSEGVGQIEQGVSSPQQPTTQDGFPPVVDRSIGTGTPTQPSVEQNLPPTQNGQAPVPEYQRPVTDQGISAQSLEPFNRPPVNSAPANTAPVGSLPSTGGPNNGVVAVPPSPQTNPQQGAATSQNLPASSSSSQLAEEEMYNQGFELLKQSKFEEASSVFEQQIKAYPQGSLADDAHYWISEAMTMVSNTDAAAQNLRAIVDNYPQSSRVPDARLRLAYIEERKNNLIEARILLQEVINKYPQSDAAIAAKNRLETLQ